MLASTMIHRSRDTPLTLLGETTGRRQVRFGIKRDDRRGHVYILGKTGMGKSTLLANIILADIYAGEGVAVVDPHGALVEEILDYIPAHRVADVVYLNAADRLRPVPFNPLAHVAPAARSLAASGLIGTFKKIWPDAWGPRLEHILRYTLLALLEIPGATLRDVPRMLTEKAFRNMIVARVADRQVRAFWEQEFGSYAAAYRTEASAPILNKIGHVLASPFLRQMVGAPENTVRFRSVMDTGKLLLVNLAKGRLGEDVSALLGAMVITRLYLAAFSRQNSPEAARRDFYLTVDEVHSVATGGFAELLSEVRKYRLNLTLAHQYLTQLEPAMRDAVLGNVGTIITFRTGAEDAEYLAREFYPVFTEADFVNLPRYHIYLKLLIDGVPSPGFSAVTLPLQYAATGHAARVITASRERYGLAPGAGHV